MHSIALTVFMVLASNSVQQVRIGRVPTIPNGIVTPPEIANFKSPSYTTEARKLKIEGVVTIEAAFDIEGKFSILGVAKGLGYGLDENAVEALKLSTFTPARRNGAPISVIAQIDVDFNLRQNLTRVDSRYNLLTPAGGNSTAPVILRRVDPQYSKVAWDLRYQGTVVIRGTLRTDGTIEALQIVRSLGFGLDENVIDAVKQWRFRPATQNGRPIDAGINIEIDFSLDR